MVDLRSNFCLRQIHGKKVSETQRKHAINRIKLNSNIIGLYIYLILNYLPYQVIFAYFIMLLENLI